MEGTLRVRTHAVLLLTLTLTLTFDLSTKTMSLVGYPKVISYTKFEHSGIIRFLVMLWTNKQTDRQTNRRTRKSYLRLPT